MSEMGTQHLDGIRLRALISRCGATIEDDDENSMGVLCARSPRNRTTAVPGQSTSVARVSFAS